MKRIAVIGGGWAGIAAAVSLTAAGQPVTVFEAGRRLGGRAREVELEGRPLDNGQHILLGAYRDTLALMQQVGVDLDAVLDRRPLEIRNDIGFRMALPRLPAPLHLAWGLLSTKGVSFGEKLATARWMNSLKARNYQLPQDQTVSEWLTEAGQTGALARQLWGPLCLAALNTPPERASAQIFCNVLRDSLGSPNPRDTDLLLPRATLSQLLPEPATRWLAKYGARLHLGARVKDLVVTEDAVFVDGEAHSAAIVATAPQHAEALIGVELPYAFEPIATVYLAYAKPCALPFPMMAMTGGLGQWVIDRGQGLLACVLSGHGDWEALPDEELAITLANELSFPEPPRWHDVIREKRATFSCLPDLPRPAFERHASRLWLAGDYTWADYPATLEGAVRSGLRAATACRASLR